MGPTREEFERMYADMKDGFAGVHNRLDLLNGRVGKGEVAQENLRTRTVSLEKEMFHVDRAGRRDNDPETRQTTWNKREGFMIGIGIGVLWGVLKVLELLGGKAFGVVLTMLSKAAS